MTLEFDEASHTYRFAGAVVPSVTQLMEASGLVPNYPSGPYRLRGSRVHQACCLYDLGLLKNYVVGEEIQRYVDSYAALMDDLKWPWLLSEYRMFHKGLCFAGTADRIGTTPRVVDLKTGKTGRETGVQLAAYTLMALEDTHVRAASWGSSIKETEVERVKFSLQSDGSKAKIEYYENGLDFHVFRGIVHRYVWDRMK